jgi:hypothetical protein
VVENLVRATTMVLQPVLSVRIQILVVEERKGVGLLQVWVLGVLATHHEMR